MSHLILSSCGKLIKSDAHLLQGGKQGGKALPAGAKAGSPLNPNGQQQPKAPSRISMGKAGSIACLEELEEAGKKKQMAEWSSDRYAARHARSPATLRPQQPLLLEQSMTYTMLRWSHDYAMPVAIEIGIRG